MFVKRDRLTFFLFALGLSLSGLMAQDVTTGVQVDWLYFRVYNAFSDKICVSQTDDGYSIDITSSGYFSGGDRAAIGVQTRKACFGSNEASAPAFSFFNGNGLRSLLLTFTVPYTEDYDLIVNLQIHATEEADIERIADLFVQTFSSNGNGVPDNIRGKVKLVN